MSWRERLAGLQELAQWELALLVGLDILRAARDPAGAIEVSRGLLRGEGQGANVVEVRPVLCSFNQPEQKVESDWAQDLDLSCRHLQSLGLAV